MINEICPRSEFPRPDFERADWLSLNGEWDFQFDDANMGESEAWYREKEFSSKIIVPYCFQSMLSGINDQSIHPYMWYKKEFKLPEKYLNKKKRILLNFGAVDYAAKVWINDEHVGMHRGGYTPFKFEITRYLNNDLNIIVLKAEDKYECQQPRGKQYWGEKPDRCWYTATSGIWQSVWLEYIGEVYIERIKLTPDIDRRTLSTEVFLDGINEDLDITIKISYKGNHIKTVKTEVTERLLKATIDLKEYDYVDEVHYWSPEAPNLYDIDFLLQKCNQQVDFVKSYFGMRKISVEGDLILLNNKLLYQKLVLDQGYWPDSLLTPPSDEAIVFDIEMTKKFGFNGARKHQKIEDPRYYYWADKLGLLVWGEMPSGYFYNDEEITNIISEWTEFIYRDYNHPCIITWVPLNESWGVRNILTDKGQQDFARMLYFLTKCLDGTRLVSSNDGWEQVVSDICGIHDYEPSGERFLKKYDNKNQLMKRAAERRLLYSQGTEYDGQPILITEYGGIAFADKEIENWGYYGCVRNENEFLERYSKITNAVRNTQYICGYCYTQLTDVQQEVNGLMTFDRRPKLDFNIIHEINS